MKLFVFIAGIFCVLATPAVAQLDQYSDPVYKRLGPDDHLPIDDMLALAREGDGRAQYIVADLYAKGRGGVARNLKEAKRWFEEAAMHGYYPAFIRLAAMAKNADDAKSAWQWYTLATKNFKYNDPRGKFAKAAREELVTEKKMTSEDISAARASLREWEQMRDQHIRDGEAAHNPG